MMFLVMIQNAWGRGKTAIEAANVARSQKGDRKSKTMPKPRVVYSYDAKKTPTVYVDEYGTLCWKGERPVTVEKVGIES